MAFSTRKSSMLDSLSVARGGAVAARIGAAREHAAFGIDGDAVGMAGELVPVAPSVDRMPAPRELVDRRARVARLDVQGVARLAEPEAAGEPARGVERLLDVAPEVDH